MARRNRGPVTTPLSEHRPHDEPDVRGALREPAHVPREPVFAVADEHAKTLPLAGKAQLLLTLNAVQHRELIGRRRDLLLLDVGEEPIGQWDVVRGDMDEGAGALRLR